MRIKTVSAVVVSVAVAGLVVTACGPGSSSSSSDVNVGLSISTLNNPFFVQLKEGAQAEAKTQSIKLTVTDAQNDASQQANQLQNFVSQNNESIIVNPVDSDASGPSVKAANRADIPVVAADRGVNKAELATTVASDNVGGGRLAAKTLADSLGGKGTVLVLQGTAGTSAARERGQGFAEGIKAYPGIDVVAQQSADFDRAKALDVTTNLLQAHRNVNGVFAQNDEMALGAVKALSSKAGAQVKVVGFDGTPDGLTAVKAGTLHASIAQQPKELGKLAVRNAVKAAAGDKLDNTVKVPVKVVTKQNVAAFTS